MVATLKKLSFDLLRLFRVPTGNPELAKAQFAAFSKQMPLLYLILGSNSLAVAWTFHGLAPDWLDIYVPAGLCLIGVMRLVWWRYRRHDVVDGAQALKNLQLTNKLGPLIALCFTAWGLAIYRYGDAYAQGQIAFYLALTVIGCIFCLMHLRSAALTVTLVVNVPFIIFFFQRGQPSLTAVAINMALVSVAMIIILFVYYRDFSNLVESKKSLIEKQAETQALSDENFRIANLDALTGLPNRRCFFAELDRQFSLAMTEGAGFAVGIIDLDGFKPVNDTYGHVTGDRVLIEAGERLNEVCRDDVLLTRLGGDEFGFIVSGGPSEDDLLSLGAAISEIIRLPYAIGTSHALIGSSIGIARYPQSAETPEDLFERADYALYYAKRNLRGQTVLFSNDHEEQIRSHGVVEQTLHNADLEAEMSLVYQPIVDVVTGEAVAFESLARWNSPVLGSVSPSSFIPVAERAGLVRTLTKILLAKALAAMKTWPAHMRLSFNLSAHDISLAESVVQIIALINRSGIDPHRIDFEITERSVHFDFHLARAALVTFKALGVGISLDDFGTGYSSLSHVHRLPLDKLKIDRSFVADIATNPASLKIVKSLLALCADMNLTCILEGVENANQLDILTELGCTMAQGYYFARPMQAVEVANWLLRQDDDQRLEA